MKREKQWKHLSFYQIIKQKNLVWCLKKDRHANVQNIYDYEPLTSADTLEDANALKDHIQSIGVETYFDNIISNSTCID